MCKDLWLTFAQSYIGDLKSLSVINQERVTLYSIDLILNSSWHEMEGNAKPSFLVTSDSLLKLIFTLFFISNWNLINRRLFDFLVHLLMVLFLLSMNLMVMMMTLVRRQRKFNLKVCANGNPGQWIISYLNHSKIRYKSLLINMSIEFGILKFGSACTR